MAKSVLDSGEFSKYVIMPIYCAEGKGYTFMTLRPSVINEDINMYMLLDVYDKDIEWEGLDEPIYKSVQELRSALCEALKDVKVPVYFWDKVIMVDEERNIPIKIIIDPAVTRPSNMLNKKVNYYKELFLYSKGHITRTDSIYKDVCDIISKVLAWDVSKDPATVICVLSNIVNPYIEEGLEGFNFRYFNEKLYEDISRGQVGNNFQWDYVYDFVRLCLSVISLQTVDNIDRISGVWND